MHADLLKTLDLNETNYGLFSGEWHGTGERVLSMNPSTGRVIAEVISGTKEELDTVVERSHAAWDSWKTVSKS